MASPISELIQNMLSIAQFREGQRVHRVEEASSRAQQLMGFINLARNTTDPKLQEGLVNTFEQLGVAPREALSQLLQYSSPTAEVVQGQALQRGIDSVQGTPLAGTLNRETAFNMLTGHGSGEALQGQFLGQLFQGAGTAMTPEQTSSLTQGLLTRTATGMDPGAFAMSRSLAGLPDQTMTAGNEIALGTRMNAAQSAAQSLNVRQQGFAEQMGRANVGLEQGRLALGWAGHRLGERQLESESAFRLASLAAETARSGALPPGAAPQLLSTQRQLMDDLQKNANNMSAPQIEQYLMAIDNTGVALQSAGYSAIRIPNPKDTGQVFRGSWWNRMRAGFSTPGGQRTGSDSTYVAPPR